MTTANATSQPKTPTTTKCVTFRTVAARRAHRDKTGSKALKALKAITGRQGKRGSRALKGYLERMVQMSSGNARGSKARPVRSAPPLATVAAHRLSAPHNTRWSQAAATAIAKRQWRRLIRWLAWRGIVSGHDSMARRLRWRTSYQRLSAALTSGDGQRTHDHTGAACKWLARWRSECALTAVRAPRSEWSSHRFGAEPQRTTRTPDNGVPATVH